MLLVGVMAGRAAAQAGAREMPAAAYIRNAAAGGGGAGAAEVPVEAYIRLHVVAGDDGEAAQSLKLRVRDAVLAEARELLAACTDADEAWRIVNQNLYAIEAAARARILAEGSSAPVTAEAGVFDFPDRRYGGVTVPAGEYRAVRVVIGAGEGHNWWCVLFPTLCLPEDCAPGEPVVFHSTILNWLRGILGGERA